MIDRTVSVLPKPPFGRLLVALVAASATTTVQSWVPPPEPMPKAGAAATTSRASRTSTTLFAKRNRKKSSDDSDINQWYDPVSPDASPDDVFFQEMERQQRMQQGYGEGVDPSTFMNANNPNSDFLASASSSSKSFVELKSTTVSADNSQRQKMQSIANSGGTASSNRITPGTAAAGVAAMSSGPVMSTNPNINVGSQSGSRSTDPPKYMLERPMPTMEQYKSAEATLSQYEPYRVAENWLDLDILRYLQEVERRQTEDDDDEEWDIEKQNELLEQQLEEWEREIEERGDGEGIDASRTFRLPHVIDDEIEPWDRWDDGSGSADDQEENAFAKHDSFDDDENDEEAKRQEELEEQQFQERMMAIQTRSVRLEKARNSEKAKVYFEREPDELQGYDTMWVSAVDNVCFKSFQGTFGNYGIEFAENFGDWEDACVEDGLVSIEDMASFKARSVYNVTGLPCISSRTSFEVEPMPTQDMIENANLPKTHPPGLIPISSPSSLSSLSTSKSSSNLKNRQIQDMAANSPRIRSGYKINDIGMNVEYLVDALSPFSEPTRVTRFKTCLCFYDGEMEIFDYGIVDVDMYFCNCMRTLVSVSEAINEMLKTLQLTFDLEYQKFLQVGSDSELGKSSGGTASMFLRDRVLKDGKVLPKDIIDVSSFMETQIDVNLMDDCANELAERFMNLRPTKILTVATTGLVIALPMAKYLQVPVVYARKERSLVMADTYSAAFSSKTLGKSRELLVSKSHLDEDDRILVIDDFLSGGSSQEALLRIISDSGATCVGVGVLLEKVYDNGRTTLAGFNVPVESLCRVASVANGVIELVEEEGYAQEQKMKSNKKEKSLKQEADESKKAYEDSSNNGNSGRHASKHSSL